MIDKKHQSITLLVFFREIISMETNLAITLHYAFYDYHDHITECCSIFGIMDSTFCVVIYTQNRSSVKDIYRPLLLTDYRNTRQYIQDNDSESESEFCTPYTCCIFSLSFLYHQRTQKVINQSLETSS